VGKWEVAIKAKAMSVRRFIGVDDVEEAASQAAK
jgi:hypothetical protein